MEKRRPGSEWEGKTVAAAAGVQRTRSKCQNAVGKVGLCRCIALYDIADKFGKYCGAIFSMYYFMAILGKGCIIEYISYSQLRNTIHILTLDFVTLSSLKT